MKRGRIPANYHSDEGKFVHSDGTAYPVTAPWKFPLFPKSKQDREWIEKLRIKYEGFFDQQSAEMEIETECMPDLGRYAALAIPPDHLEEVQNIVTRYDAQIGMVEDET
jgi:hypothetical protein